LNYETWKKKTNYIKGSNIYIYIYIYKENVGEKKFKKEGNQIFLFEGLNWKEKNLKEWCPDWKQNNTS
jgi:hypothetical protein